MSLLAWGSQYPNVLLDYTLDMVRVVYEEGLDRPGPSDLPDCIWNNDMEIHGILEARQSGLLIWPVERF